MKVIEAVLLGVVATLAASVTVPASPLPQGTTAELAGQVFDEDGLPVARAEVNAHWSASAAVTVYSDAEGKFQIAPIDLASSSDDTISLSLSKPGFFRIENQTHELQPGPNKVTLTLNHEDEFQENVEVRSSPSQVDPNTTSHEENVVQHEILNTPVPSSQDLQQSLILMPNVLMDASGRVHIAGARQGQTEVVLDGFEISDPSGQTLTPRLNVDAVQAATVETGGYGAQYAHAGAGVLMLDTKAGDDKWRFDATNFIPGVSFAQGVHFANWFPRVMFSGPLKKGRAWFSDAFTIQRQFNVIRGLPAGQDIATGWAGDNLLRAQVNLTPRNILQSSVLVNRSSNPETGLGPFTPLSTTTDVEAARYFASVKDQLWTGPALIEIGVAGDTGWTNTNPQGTATYVVTPSSASGNYFQSLAQRSGRLQLVGDITSRSLNLHGTHTLSGGWNADGIDFSQQASRSEIQIERADGTLSDLVTFFGPAAFRLANTQLGAYVQDQWRPVKPFVFSAGLRADWDRLIHQTLVQPRLAMTWIPIEDGRTRFTAAWGEHYQPINLSIIGQAYDQQRTDTFYDPTGLVQLSQVVTAFELPRTGLSQPRSSNLTAEWDEKIAGGTFFGAAYLEREGRDAFAWELESSGIDLLQNTREDRFISGEAWVRHTFGDRAELMVDYTRSRATSNQVLDPTIGSLFFSPQQPGPLPWDSPNRLISRGWTPLPVWQLLFSYFFEYHSGFPYSAVNNELDIVGAANSLRYPSYVSLNLGLEKSFLFHNHEWAIRVSSNNVTGHQNPTDVVNNVDATNFMTFGGGRSRSFSARLRLVTQH